MSEIIDLFGEKVVQIDPLRNRYIEPPFTVLDGRSGDWQMRKARWKALGIKSEEGRDVNTFHTNTRWMEKVGKPMPSNTSIFDPYLCEVMYKWFCVEGGSILDPFAGGSVRGIVAGYLGYDYTGIELRPEQVASNLVQVKDILTKDGCGKVEYICGDSNKVLDSVEEKYDMVFSCPPYADLEVYSDLEGDISNMSYDDFLVAYASIIKKSCDKLKDGGYAVFVVGEVRNKKDARSSYYGFVPDTIKCFMDAGMAFYNEAILLTPTGSAPIRAAGGMRTQKLCKVHQNVLVFKK